jgi:predicted secreted protein
MFEDKRSKKIILVAHCLLNQNSISDGTAELPSQFVQVIREIIADDVGIIQLPCPELLCLGLDRRDREGGKRELLKENTRIRALMQENRQIELLENKANELADQLEQYVNYDFRLLGLIGINRSPSCGIETTSRDGEERPGKGVFMELIEEVFKKRNVPLPMLGVKASRQEESLERLKAFLER